MKLQTTDATKNLSEFLRQCSQIKAGALDHLNEESLQVVYEQLQGASEQVFARKIALRKAAWIKERTEQGLPINPPEL